MFRVVLPIAALLWVWPAPLPAQSEPPAEFTPVTERLRALARAEDDYNEIYNVFTDELGSLRLQPPEGSAPRVTLQVIYAGPVGWIAVAWRRDGPNHQCVMYTGNIADLPEVAATAAGTVADREGVPACDP
jgi:hypothetical protein